LLLLVERWPFMKFAIVSIFSTLPQNRDELSGPC